MFLQGVAIRPPPQLARLLELFPIVLATVASMDSDEMPTVLGRVVPLLGRSLCMASKFSPS